MKRVCILSLTAIVDEPRVLRQVKTFADLGWKITLLGYPGRQPPPASADLVVLDAHQVIGESPDKWMLAKVHDSRFVLDHYWQQPGNRYIYDMASSIGADMIVGHDYFVLPVVERIGREKRIPFIVDCHEYAVAQFRLSGDLKRRAHWMMLDRPYINAIQRHCLPRAVLVTTVSDGIADLLMKDNRLARRPTVVRNMPRYEPMTATPPSDVINVLYHGLVVPTRGLEEALASLRDWKPCYRFIVRGQGREPYLASLKSLAERYGVADRVSFVPPVDVSDIVKSANDADIGYLVMENYSPQREFGLPNKIFEYAMAGLGLVVSDLTELRRLVDQYQFGVLVRGMKPATIADALNSLTPADIMRFKQNAITAARTLCWENEQSRFVEALKQYLEPPAQESLK